LVESVHHEHARDRVTDLYGFVHALHEDGEEAAQMSAELLIGVLAWPKRLLQCHSDDFFGEQESDPGRLLFAMDDELDSSGRVDLMFSTANFAEASLKCPPI
jgi:hypothetical protein